MANTAFGSGTPDDEFTSDAQAAAQAAQDAQTAAEAAQAASEAALAATLAALAAQVMDDHADVTAPAPVAGDFLQFIGGAWINNASGLDSLADVSAAAPNDDDVLQRVGGVWTAQPLVALGFLPIAGGTLTGVLTLDNDPSNALEAATKQYVDAQTSGSIYDVGFFYDGAPKASEDRRFVCSRAFYIPGTASNSVGASRVAATAIYAIDIQRNGVSIGTISWAAAATVPTFTITSASNENFVQGDVLSLVAAATPDAGIDDVSITIAGILGAG